MQITEKQDLNLKEIKADDGKYLTLFDDVKDDIKDYYSTTVMYCPMSFDNSLVREIDNEQNNKYIAEKEAAMEAEIEQMKLNI